jgi:hypothetical protein
MASDLDERALKIKQELERSAEIWQSTQIELASAWQTILGLSYEITRIFSWSSRQIASISEFAANEMYDHVAVATLARLNSLVLTESSLETSFRKLLVSSFFYGIATPENINAYGSLFLKRKSFTVDHRFVSALRSPNEAKRIMHDDIVVTRFAYANQLSSSTYSFAAKLTGLNVLISKILTETV